MKNYYTRIGIVIVIVVAAAVLLLNWFSDTSYSWYESYDSKSTQPFGTAVTRELLEAYNDEAECSQVRKPITTALTSDSNYNYIFIGSYPYYAPATIDSLLLHISKGNTGFIAAAAFPDFLQQRIYQPSLESDDYRDYNDERYPLTSIASPTVKVVFEDLPQNAAFAFHHRIQDTIIDYPWMHFSQIFGKERTPAIRAVDENGNAVMLEFTIGAGKLYLFSMPMLLTNIQVCQEDNRLFVNRILELLPPGDIIWDDYSRSYKKGGPAAEYTETEGPLRYILSMPALRNAWYTLLVGLGLFLLFRSKRQQRIIPLSEPHVNRSLEFITTVGRMHYMHKEYLYVAKEQFRYWQLFVQKKYGISFAAPNPQHIDKLATKAGVAPDIIRTILEASEQQRHRQSLKEAELLSYYKKLDLFYKNCI